MSGIDSLNVAIAGGILLYLLIAKIKLYPGRTARDFFVFGFKRLGSGPQISGGLFGAEHQLLGSIHFRLYGRSLR
jgi:hypothetical protein